MAGLISPSPSLKRSSPMDGSFDSNSENRKRVMVKHHHRICYRQQVPESSTLSAESIEDHVERALALALETAGFDAASEPALKAFREIVESYMEHFLSTVSMSMKASRRDIPIPQDFSLALGQRRLSLDTLLEQLPAKVSPQIALPHLPSPPPEDIPKYSLAMKLTRLIDPSKPSIHSRLPQHLPPLPGKHSYKATAMYTEREVDPQKIRERVAEQGRLGEGALRRLISAASTSEGRPSRTSGKARKREEMYDQIMQSAKKRETNSEIGGSSEDMDLGGEGEPSQSLKRYASDVPGFSAAAIEAVVNSESRFFRRPAKSTRSEKPGQYKQNKSRIPTI